MALSEVGVEAVVKGLSAFQSDLGKMNSSLQGLRGEGTLLQRAFGSVTEGILNFGAHVARVAEVALGVLLRDAIRAAVDFVKELVSATIDAGNEFQVLEIRLERLNFNTLIDSGVEYNKAAAEAIQLTQEQLKWLQLLAAKSPYDAQDVAKTFTLARSYGFAADEAQSLTSDILNFAAGMGLGNTEIQRIIVNFGQMVQQGKVTQREMNDLARGAFVPVNDVLSEMQKELGLTDKEFTKFKSSTEGVNAFLDAFSNLVEKRFAGATEKMSETFKASTDNVLDLVKGIFGLNTVKPILDVLGKRTAAFANSFTDNPQNWDKLVAAASRLGEALSSVVSGLFDLLPGTGDLADKIIELVNKAAQWVEDNRENIIGFFSEIGDTIRNNVVPFIKDNLIPAIQEFVAWVVEHKEDILGFFKDLGSTIINDIVPFVRDELIPAFKNFADWFIANREQIILLFDKLGDAILELAKVFLPLLQKAMDWIVENPDLVEKMIIAWAKWQVIGTILNIVGGIILSVGGFILGLVGAVSGLLGIVDVLIAVITSPLTIALLAIVGTFLFVKFMIGQVADSIDYWKEKLEEGVTVFKRTVADIKRQISEGDWAGLGRSIIDGIVRGIKWAASTLVDAARDAAMNAYNAVTDALGINSPSKLFFEIGTETMQGMALGIQRSAGLAAMTMQSAMAQVASSTMPSVTNSTVYNNTANYNLTVNSNAQVEPIAQDFNMMSSLAGV